MRDLLVQGVGWALCLVALADLYVTVLYARSDICLLSARVNQWVWGGFRSAAARLSGAHRDRLLTFAGPTLVAVVVATWLGLLLSGFALIAWPAHGDQVRKTSGPTPTDFATALYYSGYTLATLGYGDMVPQTSSYRALAVLEALVGFSVITLGLTYLLSIYSALVRRNALALALHHQGGGTDDAAELLARLGAGGDFGVARAQLSDLSRGLHDLYEAHHSYPILHYFHFREPFYAMAHIAGTMADLGTLSLTAFDRDRNRSFVESAAVAEALGGARYLLTRLSGLFLPKAYRPNGEGTPGPEEVARWRERFRAASERLARAGVAIAPDPGEAAARYVELRGSWDPYASAFARYMLAQPAGRDGAASPPGPTPGK